ncbi:hypothetical protein GTY86_15030 [Streptomyces sp. SID5770]|nr:hypothetical protein [Streptomyces sp. SID5770]
MEIAGLKRRGGDTSSSRAQVILLDATSSDLADHLSRLLDAGKADNRRTLWLDDAHLCSVLSLQELRKLLMRRSHRIIVAADTDRVHPEFHRLWKDGLLRRIDLSPLDPESSRELASAFLGDQLSQEGVVRLAQLSAGLPLLLRELVRAASEQHLFNWDGSCWQLDDVVPVSAGLRELTQRQLTALSASATDALEMISLATPARLSILEEVVGTDSLLELEERRLIEVSPRDLKSLKHWISVSHPYLGHVLRQDMPTLKKRRNLTVWLDALPGRDDWTQEEWTRLSEWHLEAGETPEMTTLLMAVYRALDGHQFPLAVQLSEAAWSAYPCLDAAKAYGYALLASSQFDKLEEQLSNFRLAVPGHEDEISFIEARSLALQGRYEEAECVANTLPDGDREMIVSITSYFNGDVSKSLECASRAKSFGEVGRITEAAIIQMASLCHLGRPIDALSIYDDISKLRNSGLEWTLHGDSLEEIHALALQYAGRLAEAERILKEQYENAIREYCVRIHAQRGLALGYTLYEMGRVEESIKFFKFNPNYRVGWWQWEIKADLYLSMAVSCLGHPPIVTRDGDYSPSYPESKNLPFFLSAIAQCRKVHGCGNERQAVTILNEALSASLDGRSYANAVAILHEYARLDLPIPVKVHDYLPVQGPFLKARLQYARAVEKGDISMLSEAVGILEEIGSNLYSAEGYAELSRMYHRRGDVRSATAASLRAQHLSSMCGSVDTPALQFYNERVPLAPRERTIARLAAEGFTDKEIAERLVISPRTVSNTLLRVYQKVGVNGRRQLRGVIGSSAGGAVDRKD